jgi:MOSC domain-containing protein YiiM
MGRLERIWIKRAMRGPMDRKDRATMVAGEGLAGNAHQGGQRQVTVLSQERWAELMTELDAGEDPNVRRANLFVSGVELVDSRGKILRIGETRLEIRGETRPCNVMDEALPGLQEAMRARWGGGAFGVVLTGGDVAVGDAVSWE